MKKAMFFILCFYLTMMAQLLFPYWWTAALIPCVLAIWQVESNKQAFWEGGGSIACMWLTFALYTLSTTEGLLAKRVAIIFQLPHESLLLIITILIGGLAGGCGAIIGFQSKTLWRVYSKTLINKI